MIITSKNRKKKSISIIYTYGKRIKADGTDIICL